MKLNKAVCFLICAAVCASVCGCGNVADSTAVSADKPVTTTTKPERSFASRDNSSEKAEDSSETDSTSETDDNSVPAEDSSAAAEDSSAQTTTTTTTAALQTEPSKTLPAVGTITDNGEYIFTEEYQKFLGNTVFVGDSICLGLEAYGKLPENNVLATGNVGARSIFDYNFKLNGSEVPLLDALKTLSPRCVVFSMGMNDVNMTSAETFVDNYNNILDKTHAVLPDAVLVVESVTPIATSNDFCSNSKIDEYNAALKKFLDSKDGCYFVNVAEGLKGADNGLGQGLSSGDGIHLAPAAYDYVMYKTCQTIVDGGYYKE